MWQNSYTNSYQAPAGASFGLGALGVLGAIDCSGVDWRKYIGPMLGFMYGHPLVEDINDSDAWGNTVVSAMKTQFPKVYDCVQQNAAKDPAVKDFLLEKGYFSEDFGPGFAVPELSIAGRKMFENDWWSDPAWYDYWVRWSGAEPFYKNPYYVGGIGAVGVAAAWFLLRKKRK